METAQELTRRSALHALDRAEALLALGEAAGLLDVRLAPDMFAFRTQIAVATGFARRAVLPMTGEAPERHDPDHSPEGLRAAIFATRAQVAAAEGPAPDRVAHRAGEADLDQSALDYAACFALPNLWFHLSMAYAILCANGAAVGKAEFDGLHKWSPDVRLTR